MAGAQLAPIVSEARTLGQFVAPAHQRLCALAQNLWWSWDAETTSLFRELDPVLWRELDHNPVALLQQIPIDKLEERASQLALHSRINYAYRRMQEYLRLQEDLGRAPRRRAVGAAGRVLLGRVRPARVAADLLGRPRHSAGDHIKSASDLGIPLVGVGLYYDQGYFRQRLDRDGWQHEDYIDVDSRLLPIAAGRLGHDGEPVTVSIETRTGTICRARLAAGGRPQHAAAARLERRGQPPGGPRADGAALRRRRARAHPAGAAARRRRRPRARRAGHHAGRPAPERRTQRVRRAGARPAAHGDRRDRRRRGAAPRRRRRSSSPRTRRCRPATIASRPT